MPQYRTLCFGLQAARPAQSVASHVALARNLQPRWVISCPLSRKSLSGDRWQSFGNTGSASADAETLMWLFRIPQQAFPRSQVLFISVLVVEQAQEIVCKRSGTSCCSSAKVRPDVY